MKLNRWIAALLVLSFAAGGAFAATDKAKKQAEVRKSTHAALAKFYKAEPQLKKEVAKAPGYAVFTTFGLSFIVGGEGGRGLVHNNRTKKDTFIVFKTAKAMNEFVEKGWEFGGGGSLSAGAGGKTAGGGSGENVIADALYYTYTKTGLEGGGAVAGTKFWKDDELN